MTTAVSQAARRPIRGWEGYYSITADGQVFSERARRFIQYATDNQRRPYIEVQIGAIRYERSILSAVQEAWGHVSQLSPIQRTGVPRLDPAAVKVGDQLRGTYQPPIRWGKPRRYAPDVGKRGTFDCVGVITAEDRQGSVGSMAMAPIDGDFEFSRCPLDHLVDLERVLPR